MKTLVTTFGRMNPPHKGHIELINNIKEIANQVNGTPVVFLSHSEHNKKNPLSYQLKTTLLHELTNGIVKFDYDNKVKQPINVLHYAKENLFDDVIFVCGQDRYNEYSKSIIEFVNSRDYFKFKNVEVRLRNESSYDITGTQMRQFVLENKQKEFFSNLPEQLTIQEKELIWSKLNS